MKSVMQVKSGNPVSKIVITLIIHLNIATLHQYLYQHMSRSQTWYMLGNSSFLKASIYQLLMQKLLFTDRSNCAFAFIWFEMSGKILAFSRCVVDSVSRY